MPSSKYHRKQAQVLASLALSVDDPTLVEMYQVAATEHLERAAALESGDASRPRSENNLDGA